MDNHPAIRECLLFLAGRCNYATSHDGAGFNKLDAEFGHSLAGKVEKYDLTARQHQAALRMMTKYKGQLASANLALPTSEELEKFLTDRDLRKAEEAKGKPPGFIALVDGRILVKYPFNAVFNEALRKTCEEQQDRLLDEGYTPKHWNFDRITGAWNLPADWLEAVYLDTFPSFALDDAAQTALKAILELRQKKAEQAERERKGREQQYRALKASLDLDAVLPSGRTLRPYQKEGIDRMMQYSYSLLADDMGLGKTMQALMTMKAYQMLYNCPIFVICDSGLKENWRREVELIGGMRVEIFSNHYKSIPVAPQQHFVVIFEEAHKYQNPKAKRTEKALALARSPYCRAAICITGTPFKNGRPQAFLPLLQMLRHPLAENPTRFYRRYCRIGGNWKGQDQAGATHLDELRHELLEGHPCLIRRTKAQCLQDLPEKIRALHSFDLEGEAKTLYMHRFNELRQDYYRRVAAGEISTQGDALVMLGHLRHAGSIAKVPATVELALDIMEGEFDGPGEQVVIFTIYKDSARMLAEKLDAEVLDGDIPAKHRQAMIDRFQAGQRRALVCLYGVGGEGHTLTAASTVILVDRPWTPGEAIQAEDRLHRIGQKRTVTPIWLQATEVDRRIDELLLRKKQTIDRVLEGEQATIGTEDDIGRVAKDLLKEFFR